MQDIKIQNFSTFPEAQMAKDILKQAGIKSLVKPTNRSAAGAEGVGYATWDCELYVQEKDAKKVKEIIDTYFKTKARKFFQNKKLNNLYEQPHPSIQPQPSACGDSGSKIKRRHY